MPSAYEVVIFEVEPEDPKPVPAHDDQFFCQQQLVKKKGRRKKADPYKWMHCFVPWDDLNQTELLTLCMEEEDRQEEHKRWWILHRGLDRELLIGIIRGLKVVDGLPPNPFHQSRNRLQHFMFDNWKYIWSQIRCNTCCWECSDAQVQECVLENGKNLPNPDPRK